MKILFVTSEATPFAASGGLGDVMGALPVACREQNHEVSVIMPLYSSVKEEHRSKMEYLCDIEFNLSWRRTGCTVYKLLYKDVKYLFVENHYYFDRKGLYGEHDDIERFAFFSRAVLEYMLTSADIPDILHANDWQSAASVVYLKTEYSSIEALSSVKAVYTVHNIEYQGWFSQYQLGDIFGIDSRYSSILEHGGALNLMKGALLLSDLVTTVSPGYSRELEYDFFSFDMSSVIKSISHKMHGIINGIDYDYFSPDKGGDIDFPFTRSTLKRGKAKNKASLQSELGLEVREEVPLMVMITRLTATKGVDLVLHVLEEILDEDIQLVLLGTGDVEYEQRFSEIASKRDNFKALIKFDRAISKKMYASADLFLMPSKSEPCGLAQMIACSYGTVPIVRSVGGLGDTIIPYGEKGANGFRFDNYNAHEMLYAIKYALSIYKNTDKWAALRRSAISSDFTWNRSAEKYIRLYNELVK